MVEDNGNESNARPKINLKMVPRRPQECWTRLLWHFAQAFVMSKATKLNLENVLNQFVQLRRQDDSANLAIFKKFFPFKNESG